MNERCDKCRYWRQHDTEPYEDPHPDDQQGSCHRYPPAQNANYEQRFLDRDDDTQTWSDYRAWDHPVTCGMDWCGEFNKAKPGSPRTAQQ